MSDRNKAKPRRKFAKGDRNKTGAAGQSAMAGVIDALIKFEDFSSKVLPAIQKDLQAGMSAKELREKYASLVQARQLTTALISEDEGRASAAAKDIMDRAEGKATERKEVTHKYENLSDEELEAIIRSEEEELGFLETNTEH